MKIRVETTIQSNLDSVWNAWINPEDIKQWNAASDDWHTTEASVDLRVGGGFTARMEAKDGSMGFDFAGTYSKVVKKKQIEYVLEDGRNVSIEFVPIEDGVKVIETFEAEEQHEIEYQRQGWQSILNNFAKYVKSNA